jgi:hypothetical protein
LLGAAEVGVDAEFFGESRDGPEVRGVLLCHGEVTAADAK